MPSMRVLPKQSRENHHEPCHPGYRTGGCRLHAHPVSIGFLARFSYALARNPVLPFFAVALGAGREEIGLAFAIVATLLCASIPLLRNTVREEPQTANL